MDIEKADSDKKELVVREMESIEYISDLWLGTAEKKDMPFVRLYRLVSLIVIVIQFMVLGSVIYENITQPPHHNLSFQIVSARLFVVFYLAANVVDCFSKDVLGYYALSRVFFNEFDDIQEDESFCAQLFYLVYLIAQGFYFALGFPALLLGVVRMCNDDFSLRDLLVFAALSAYEYVLLVLVLIASVSVILIQSDAVSILFNFLGVLVVMQLDDMVLKLIHIKVHKMEKLKYTEFHLTSAKISLAGFVGVVTFMYSFMIRT